MGDTGKKKNSDQSERQKQIEETSKGSILKHIPGVSEGSIPMIDEEIEEEYWKNAEEGYEAGGNLEWRQTELEDEDEYLAEESLRGEDDQEDWSEEEDEYWEEDEEGDEEDKLRREYKKQESELKQRFKEGQ